MRGVVGHALGGQAKPHNSRFAAHYDKVAFEHVKAYAARDAVAILEQIDHQNMVDHFGARAAHIFRQARLDVKTVVDVNPPGAGLTESHGTHICAVRIAHKFDAGVFQHLQTGLHCPVVIFHHSTRHARRGRGIVPVHVFQTVMFRLIEHRHEMIVAAAKTAGTLQLALVHQQHLRPGLARGNGRAAAGGAGTKHQHVSLVRSFLYVHTVLLIACSILLRTGIHRNNAKGDPKNVLSTIYCSYPPFISLEKQKQCQL